MEDRTILRTECKFPAATVAQVAREEVRAAQAVAALEEVAAAKVAVAAAVVVVRHLSPAVVPFWLRVVEPVAAARPGGHGGKGGDGGTGGPGGAGGDGGMGAVHSKSWWVGAAHRECQIPGPRK